MKKGVIISSLCLVGILVLGGVFYSHTIKDPFKTNEDFVIEVQQGDNLYNVISRLKDEGKLKNVIIPKIYIKSLENKPDIKPGEYKINKNSSLKEFLSVLEDATLDQSKVQITIPEGYDITQIASLLQEKGIIEKEIFLESFKNYTVPTYIKADNKVKYPMEGFLFPDTYTLKKGSSGEEIIKVMNDRFNEEIEEITNDKKLSDEELYKIVTMASIVEREASNPEERDVVASVFYNRINKNMKFQSCATVQYALGEHKEKLYEKDLTIESPYNTYLVDGMPIGPISNPGRESLKAAINPKSTNYLYFVSNNDGTHFFTDDYNEFLKVKEKTQGF
ncbi:endolytic transglycosylase MltG [Clostridium senegalense]|uniref:endolytic transglycosylase MltG n=1 Tax=Clostridium senegalense TaxID=1465809 RepID=UPI0002894FA0|nr:endolytic transglycosylase MltG [Clostridium senegalense]